MPNTPYLDKSVRWRLATGNQAFHELRYSEVSAAILDSGLATEVVGPIGSGKEANVLLCLDGERPVVVKAYRLYRTSQRGPGSVRSDTLGYVAAREFELLGYAFGSRAPVPEPLVREENMLSMSFIGDAEGPAPRLRETPLEEPQRFCDELLEGIDALARAGIVHTDLSPFNILVHRGHPWIIDLADGLRVDRLGGSPFERVTKARDALRHGLTTLERHFRRYGVEVPVEPMVARLVERFDRFHLLE